MRGRKFIIFLIVDAVGDVAVTLGELGYLMCELFVYPVFTVGFLYHYSFLPVGQLLKEVVPRALISICEFLLCFCNLGFLKFCCHTTLIVPYSSLDVNNIKKLFYTFMTIIFFFCMYVTIKNCQKFFIIFLSSQCLVYFGKCR